ncbi:Gfo/Idh/MocA family protein [Ornithinibacillus halotolerans]|uniref:Gfo/Idh/MocA family oxidoreductase n=1 Tax=Ornithinibacillus halotolerans TaxID=1274357 RepID=A0A916RXN3_9BACI|nr:Gfo/Idh/MocA family oxidoreductase [Ornithinibacillus halotolerans]GGA72418.1 hypothetical protein GCM10008025_15260 [Ornithinibacillus halotolerans]
MIHIGIIGLGAIGQRLITQFNEHDQVKVEAICDTSESILTKTANELSIEKAYLNYQDLINDEQVDLVYVAVPPKFHHKIVMDVIKARKHVLCEKPLANSVKEAEEMLEAAKEAGIIHAMNFPLNYGQAATKFASLIKSGAIGNLRRLQLTMQFPQWPRTWQQNDWIGGREQGGFVLEVGVHFIQQILKLFGDIHHIHTKLELPSDQSKCETGIIATAELHDGTPIIIEGISNIPGKEYIGFTAIGTEGSLSLENWGQLRGAKIGEELKEITLNELPVSGLIDELVKAIEGEPADIYDFEIGYKAQVVLEKLRNK